MVDPYFLRSLGLTGFRAYLQPKTFVFSKKRCLAIFAPNGSGKSSVIDALEFMFSKDGTLERLGQRAINNQAGPVALAHNLADEAQIMSGIRNAAAELSHPVKLVSEILRAEEALMAATSAA